MKKTISILIVLAMLLSMVPAVFAAEDISGTITAAKGKDNKYDTETWTADEDGILTISLSSEEGLGYVVYCNGEALSLLYELTYGCELKYEVKAGDKYHVNVMGWNPDSMAYCDATIAYSFSFSAGGALKSAYEISEQVIEKEGNHEVVMIPTAELTIVTVTPEEAGIYTITVDEGALIGNYGGGAWYIYDHADMDVSLEWTCEQAGYWETVDVYDEETGTTSPVEQFVSGQSLMLGILSDSETVTVNVEKTGEYTSSEIVTLTYENKVELTPFTLPADATLGGYVDVYGDTHTAVLGSDGYYHLDSAGGDILLVDMDYMYTLSAALQSDRPVMYAYTVDENGTTIKHDIGAAVQAYEAVCDENGYYPLTEDLIFFYDTYAGGAGVHQFVLGEGYNAECAWMFACMTMAMPKAEDDVLTIAEAIELALAGEHNVFTEEKYYVTGVITEVYNEKYGNMRITDEEGNVLTLYGTYSADGSVGYADMEVKPVAGDTITVYGPIGRYYETPQVKNGWIVEHIPGEGEPEVPEVPEDPEADSVLTVAEAIALGQSKASNVYTEGKYYVTGVITEVYNEQYGNMRITDEAGNILTVYGTYSADGSLRYDAMEVKPVAGDTVTVYGIIGNYNGTAQIKNGWITEHVVAEQVDPAPDTELTIAEAIALGESKDHNNYTAGKYYVTGVITEVYNETYGNMYITDGDGNVLTVYGTYSADGSLRYDSMDVKPVAGDTVTVYGIIGNYKDAAQMKNGWITEHVPGAGEQEGSGTFEDPFIIHSLPVELSAVVPAGGMLDQYYLYVAEQDGSIEIKDSNDDFNAGSLFLFVNNWMDATLDTLFDLESVHLNEAVYCEVKAGDSILINYFQPNYMPDDWALDVVLQFASDSTGGEGGDPDQPGGEDPEIPDEPIPDTDKELWTGEDVAVKADEEIEIIFTPEADGELQIDVSCATGWQVSVSGGDNEEAFWSDSHEGAVTVQLLAGVTYSIKLIPYDQAAEIGTCDAVMDYKLTFGDAEELPELVIGDNHLELLSSAESVSYSYTATQTGKLYFVISYVGLDMSNTGSYDDDTDDIVNDFTYSTALTVNGESLPYIYFGTVDVVEGETYIFNWADVNEYFSWSWEATLNLSYTDENYPVIGSETIPVELNREDCPTQSIEIPADSRVYYNLVGFTGSNFTIKGVGAYAVVVTTEWNMETGEAKQVETRYDAVNGVVTVPVTAHYFTVQIGNSRTSAATFALDAFYPVGSYENPAELEIGENVVTLDDGAEDGYMFIWTADRDGSIVIDISGQYWMYSVTNYGSSMEDYEGDTYGDWHVWSDDPQIACEEWVVKAGDIIVINVCAYDPAAYAYVADTITVTASYGIEIDPDVVLGDVNGDDVVDTTDAYLIVLYYNERMELDDAQLAAADVSGDGAVDTTDAYYIVLFYNERIDSFPAEE